MRVLILNFILSTPTNGKIVLRQTNHETMIYNLARGFVANGDQVTLCAAEDFKPLKLPEEEPFEIVYFPLRWKRYFKAHQLPYPIGLGKYLRSNRGDFDMVLSIEAFSMPTLIAALNVKDKTMIWHEVAHYRRRLTRVASKIWQNVVGRLFLRKIHLLAQSEIARDYCRQYYDNVETEVLGHGSRDDVFIPSDSADDYFVVVSRLVPLKAIDDIIRCFGEFVNLPKYSHFKLRIIGDGPERASLESLIIELGLKRCVVMEGGMAHKEYAAIAARAKGLLIKTKQDNNMLTVPEAILSGNPILMNTVPTNHSFVRDLGVGLVKDDWGVAELVEMVEHYEQFHTNCLAHRHRFTIRSVARRLKEIFQKSQ